MTTIAREATVEVQRRTSGVPFERFVETYRAPMCRMVFRIVRDNETAEDVVQEAFMRAYASLPSFVCDRHVGRWLTAIVRNAAIDTLRRSNRRQITLERYARSCEDRAPGPEELAIRYDAARALMQRVERLPERYRDALRMYYVRELRYREIACELGVPIGTVKTFLARAKRRLRDEILRDVPAGAA